MSKSKLRGGAKAHRNRVSKRNVKQHNDFNRVNKIKEEMKLEFEKMAEQQNNIVEVENTEINKEVS